MRYVAPVSATNAAGSNSQGQADNVRHAVTRIEGWERWWIMRRAPEHYAVVDAASTSTLCGG